MADPSTFVAVEAGRNNRIEFVKAESKDQARNKVINGYDKLYSFDEFSEEVEEKLSMDANPNVTLVHLR